MASDLYSVFTTCMERLISRSSQLPTIIEWGCPVLFFGHADAAQVATVGINPSSREFLDESGDELAGDARRLPSLGYFGLSSWGEADASQVREVVRSCSRYFRGNPYERWFGTLDRLLGSFGFSYHSSTNPACHLDVVPYATRVKWGSLTPTERRNLFEISHGALARLLLDTEIRLLILNGRAVVDAFENVLECGLSREEMSDWHLPQRTGGVTGVAYTGNFDSVGGIPLDRQISVLGFNHNLQSSFGVSSSVIDSIAEWLNNSVSISDL